MFTKSALQPHGLDLSAPGALVKLFELRRGTFGNAVMEQEGGDGGNSGDGDKGGSGGDAGTSGETSGAEGFPANTSVKDMEPGEQAAYWKHQSRKNEDRWKAYGDITPEQVTKLKQDTDAARTQSLSEQDRAVEEAKEAGRAEIRSQLGAERVRNALVKSLEGRMPDPGAMLGLDLSEFVDGDKAKTDEIKKWVDENSTADSDQQKQNRFPGLGQGNREQSKVTDRDAGQSEAERRFGKKS